MSDNNPRLKKWLDQVEQGKYQTNHIKTNYQSDNVTSANNTIIFNVNETSFSYVGFWRRFFAQFIDSIVLGVFSTFFLKNPNNSSPLIILLIWFFYYTIFPCTQLKGTIGKVAIGAVIVDKNGNRLSYLHSVGRFFASLLSGTLFLIGFIMVAFHHQKRGLHDRLAATYVVNKKEGDVLEQ